MLYHKQKPQELFCIHLIAIHAKYPEVPLKTLQDVDRLLNEANSKLHKINMRTMRERVNEMKELLEALEETHYEHKQCDN